MRTLILLSLILCCIIPVHSSMKLLVQNIQKKPGLATSLWNQHSPDIFLAQEIYIDSEKRAPDASFTSGQGYGTAIYSQLPVSNIRQIFSPYAELLPTIRKK